jgi:hypothetical protein
MPPYTYSAYTQPLRTQGLGETSNILTALMKSMQESKLRETKQDYSEEVRREMQSVASKAKSDASGIGKAFGLGKLLSKLAPGPWANVLGSTITGLESKELKDLYNKASDKLGSRYGGTFMGGAVSDFRTKMRDIGKEYDPLSALAQSAMGDFIMGKSKQLTAGEKAVDVPEVLESPGMTELVEKTVDTGDVSELVTDSVERPSVIGSPGRTELVPSVIEKSWKEMSPKERLSSIFGTYKGAWEDPLEQIGFLTSQMAPLFQQTAGARLYDVDESYINDLINRYSNR